MSKATSLSCPQCGAPLPHADPGRRFCEFCGAPITVTPESLLENEPRKFGYEFEKGRYDAQNSIPGLELAEKIHELIQPLADLHRAEACLADLEKKVALAKEDVEKADRTNKILMYALPLLLFYALFSRGMNIFISLAVALGVFIIYKGTVSLKMQSLQDSYSSYKDQMSSAMEQLNVLLNTYNFDLIPEEYRQREAMIYFVKVLKNGRAASLQQAINLYEEEKHQKRIFRLQEEELALKQQALDVQRQQLENDQEFKAKHLELAQNKKGVDWGAVAAAAGSVAIAALTLKGKKK